MRAAAAALLLVAACSGRDPAPAAPSAGRISLELDWTNAESSKDSHDTIERYRISGGRMTWETETKGYGEDRTPKRSGEIVLDEQTLVRLTDRCLELGLTADATWPPVRSAARATPSRSRRP